MNEQFVTHGSQEEGHILPHRTTQGSTSVHQEAERTERKCGHEPLSRFLREGMGQAG